MLFFLRGLLLRGFDAKLIIATGARTTPIIESFPPHKNPPLETPERIEGSGMWRRISFRNFARTFRRSFQPFRTVSEYCSACVSSVSTVRPVFPVVVFQPTYKQQNRTQTDSSTVFGTPPDRTQTKRSPLEKL